MYWWWKKKKDLSFEFIMVMSVLFSFKDSTLTKGFIHSKISIWHNSAVQWIWILEHDLNFFLEWVMLNIGICGVYLTLYLMIGLPRCEHVFSITSCDSFDFLEFLNIFKFAQICNEMHVSWIVSWGILYMIVALLICNVLVFFKCRSFCNTLIALNYSYSRRKV